MRPVAKRASALSMDECGEGPVEVEKLLHVGGAGRLLAECAKSTGEGSANADKALERFDGHTVELAASLSCSAVTLLVCKMRTTSLADSWVATSNVETGLDGGRGPCVWRVVFE